MIVFKLAGVFLGEILFCFVSILLTVCWDCGSFFLCVVMGDNIHVMLLHVCDQVS